MSLNYYFLSTEIISPVEISILYTIINPPLFFVVNYTIVRKWLYVEKTEYSNIITYVYLRIYSLSAYIKDYNIKLTSENVCFRKLLEESKNPYVPKD